MWTRIVLTAVLAALGFTALLALSIYAGETLVFTVHR
jgi:hypothetical protein